MGLRADEFVEAGERALVVGIYWIRDDSSRADPFVFQHVTVTDSRIVHIQDYRLKDQALEAASAD
jgi:hypothetical protein